MLAFGLGYCLFGLSGCTTERYAPAVDAKVDSALTKAGIPPLAVRRIKFNGPVTFQIGQGNTSTTVGKDKTGQRAQALATGANSHIEASQKKGGVPFWVFIVVGILSIVGWDYLTHQFNPLKWLPWHPGAG